MRNVWQIVVDNRVGALLALASATAFVALTLVKKRFAKRAASWPGVQANIENIFLDVSERRTHAILAYSYTVGGSNYSGQIRLTAGEWSLDTLDKEIVGQKISVRYDPHKPEVSVFSKHRVRGWYVERDSRLSAWTSIETWLDKLP